MTKPKFTPDPPPYLGDMDTRQALMTFVEWVIRQENRKEDWWPKDLEARVNALELLVPFCTGTWIIADPAYVSFAGYLVGEYGACSPDTATYQTSFAYNIAGTNFETDMQGTFITSDGLMLFTSSPGSGGKGSGIYKFDMSSAFDLSTMSFTDNAQGFLAITPGGGLGSGSAPWGVNFNPDGTKLFFYDEETSGFGTNARVVCYSLSSGFDLSTASYHSEISVQTNNPNSITFVMSRDGKHLYLTENVSDTVVYQYDLSQAWVITTATFIQSEALTPTYSSKPVRGLSIDSAGKYIIVSSKDTAKIEVFELATPFDISTESWSKTVATSGSADNYGAYMAGDCSTLIITTGVANRFDEYTIG